MRVAALLLGLLLLVPLLGFGLWGVPGEEGASETTPAPDKQENPTQVAGWTGFTPALGYNVREGRKLFRHYCLPCHGREGHGDGFNAYNLDPKPRNLADPAFQKERSDDDLAAIIQTGGGAAGLSTGMPPWGRTLNKRQIHNLVLYLRLLGKGPPKE